MHGWGSMAGGVLVIAHESAHLSQDNNVKFGIISAEKQILIPNFWFMQKKHGNNLKPMYNSCVIRYKSICQLANAGDYRKKEVKT